VEVEVSAIAPQDYESPVNHSQHQRLDGRVFPPEIRQLLDERLQLGRRPPILCRAPEGSSVDWHSIGVRSGQRAHVQIQAPKNTLFTLLLATFLQVNRFALQIDTETDVADGAVRLWRGAQVNYRHERDGTNKYRFTLFELFVST
jgi:hypothetical protein